MRTRDADHGGALAPRCLSIALGSLAVLVGAAGCLESTLVRCADDTVCPPDLVCDGVHGGCIEPAQLSACAGVADGEVCRFGTVEAVCLDEVCLIPGCGNRVVEPGEVCDDGGRAPGDGCSDRCDSLEVCGNAVLDAIAGEACDDGNLVSLDGCSSACATETLTAAIENLGQPDFATRLVAWHAASGRLVVIHPSVGNQPQAMWRWDASRWERLAGTIPPGDVLVEDPVRAELLLIGEATWAWDGDEWRLRAEAGPPPRRDPAVGFDAARGEVVLFGGADATGVRADTWIWDGTSWTERLPAQAPPPRTLSAMAYAPGLTSMLLFGGAPDDDFASQNVLDDTWAWDGTTWTPRVAANPAAARAGHAMATHGVGVTMLGGFSCDEFDCYTRGGATWTGADWQVASAPSLVGNPLGLRPSLFSDGEALYAVSGGGVGRAFATLVDDAWQPVTEDPLPNPPPVLSATYDTTRGRVVALAGSLWPDGEAATWLWDGAWSPAGSVSLQGRPQLAYDGSRGVVVAVTTSSQTWEYVDDAWTLRSTGYVGNFDVTLGYDPRAGRVVLFGILPASDRALLEWDGAAWIERPVVGARPPRRAAGTLVYDAARDVLVLHGGSRSDTWELDGDTWTEVPSPPQSEAYGVLYEPRTAALWFIDRASNTELRMWQQRDGALVRYVAPTPTVGPFTFVADPIRGRVIGFGGGYQETWSLGYQGATPVEACLAGGDADGDGLSGCDDGDCWAHCAPQCPPMASCPEGGPRCGDGACTAIESTALCPADC